MGFADEAWAKLPVAASSAPAAKAIERRGIEMIIYRSIAPACRWVNNEGVRYVALLRGINVGGKNIVKMSDLRRALEGVSCTNVATYIQSGNVLFESRLGNTSRLSLAIEEALTAELA